MTASSAQVNPYVRALLHVGWVALAVAALFAMISVQEASRLGAAGDVLYLAASGWLATIGVAALLLWLLAAAILWQPRVTRPMGPTSRSENSAWK